MADKAHATTVAHFGTIAYSSSLGKSTLPVGVVACAAWAQPLTTGTNKRQMKPSTMHAGAQLCCLGWLQDAASSWAS